MSGLCPVDGIYGDLARIAFRRTGEIVYNCGECDTTAASAFDLDEGLCGSWGEFIDARGWEPKRAEIGSEEPWPAQWPDAERHRPPQGWTDLPWALEAAFQRLTRRAHEYGIEFGVRLVQVEHLLLAATAMTEEAGQGTRLPGLTTLEQTLLELSGVGEQQPHHGVTGPGLSALVAARHGARGIPEEHAETEAVAWLLGAVVEEIEAGCAPTAARLLERVALTTDALADDAHRPATPRVPCHERQEPEPVRGLLGGLLQRWRSGTGS